MTPPDRRTRTLVLTTILVWVVWDLYVWLAGRETISAVFGLAFSWPWLGWWVIGAYGFTCGHLIGMTDPVAPHYWWRVAVGVVAGGVGWWLTWRQW